MTELYIKAIMIYYGYTLEKAKQIYSVMDEAKEFAKIIKTYK